MSGQEELPIYNLQQFMAVLGEYMQDGQSPAFSLFVYPAVKKQGKPRVDYDKMIDRFQGFNPQSDPNLPRWLSEAGVAVLKPGKQYLVAACEPGTFNTIAATVVEIPRDDEEAESQVRKAQQQDPRHTMVEGVLDSVNDMVAKKVTGMFQDAFEGPKQTVGGSGVNYQDEEEEEEMVKLPNGMYLPKSQVLAKMMEQHFNPTPQREEKEEKGVDVMGLIEKYGPMLQGAMGTIGTMLQKAMVPQAPTVGYYPPPMQPGWGQPQYPMPQQQYPQPYPPQPMPGQQPFPQTTGGQPVPNIADLAQLAQQIPGLEEMAKQIPGLEGVLNQLTASGAPGNVETQEPSFEQPTRKSPPLTSIPGVPGMDFADDAEVEEDEAFENTPEFEEEDILGPEGRELAKKLYSVIYPIYRKMSGTNLIDALAQIQEVGVCVFKEDGLRLFTPDILEDWCEEAATAESEEEESDSARELYNCLPWVNRKKIRFAGGDVAESAVIATMAKIMSSLRGQFLPDELL